MTPTTSFRRSINKVSVAAEAKKKDAAAMAEARKKGAEAVAAAAANMAAAAEAEAKKKKKKVVVRVHQDYIDGILEVYPFKPFPCDPEEIEKTIPDPETRELLPIMTASVAAETKARRAKDEAIIKQYYDKGYAEEEVEVTDDEEEEEA